MFFFKHKKKQSKGEIELIIVDKFNDKFKYKLELRSLILTFMFGFLYGLQFE